MVRRDRDEVHALAVGDAHACQLHDVRQDDRRVDLRRPEVNLRLRIGEAHQRRRAIEVEGEGRARSQRPVRQDGARRLRRVGGRRGCECKRQHDGREYPFHLGLLMSRSPIYLCCKPENASPGYGPVLCLNRRVAALYRKYRPQSFDEVVGQEAVVRTLKNAIASNQVRQAYLFAGPRGTGKTSLARILAKSLNCANGPSVTPDGTCHACLAIAAGTSLDVIEMDAASQRGIDDIREIRDRVVLQPVEGRYKVYILDEAHQLTDAAWNALLKLIE